MMIAYDAAANKLRDVLNRIFGESWSLSCPVPGTVNGIAVDKHFLYPIATDSSQGRPFALVVSDMNTGTILMMKHCAAEDFVDTNKHPFNEPISGELPGKMSVKEYKDGMCQLRRRTKPCARSSLKAESRTKRRQSVTWRCWRG